MPLSHPSRVTHLRDCASFSLSLPSHYYVFDEAKGSVVEENELEEMKMRAERVK